MGARFPHRSVLADVDELHHRVSSDELEDLSAGEPTADGVGQGVYLPTPEKGVRKRGWDPTVRVEHPNRKARGRGTCLLWIRSDCR